MLELIQAMKRIARKDPLVHCGPRRQGDPPKLVASFVKAKRELGWTPRQSEIDFIVKTALAWRDRVRPSHDAAI